MFILKNNPSLRRMSQIRRNFGATCTLKGTRARKSLVGVHYTQAQGRSMVEMLGVLAIIGVLSVGAIAGYSKAMMKVTYEVLFVMFNHYEFFRRTNRFDKECH